MTTIITRLYEDEKTAQPVVDALHEEGFPANTVMLISGGDAEAQMTAADVAEDAAATYAAKVAEGNAVVVVRAPLTPFGAARRAMEIVDATPSIHVGIANDNVYLSDAGRAGLSVMTDHPHMLLSKSIRARQEPVTALIGFPMLSEPRTSNSVFDEPRTITGKSFPLITRPRRRNSAASHKHIFSMFPLLSRRKGRRSVSPNGGGPIFSQLLGMRLPGDPR